MDLTEPMIIGEDSMEKGEREKEGNGYGSIKPTITIRTDEPSTNPFKKSVSLENLYFVRVKFYNIFHSGI